MPIGLYSLVSISKYQKINILQFYRNFVKQKFKNQILNRCSRFSDVEDNNDNQHPSIIHMNIGITVHTYI